MLDQRFPLKRGANLFLEAPGPLLPLGSIDYFPAGRLALLELLLGAEVVRVAALLLAAVDRAGVEARVALAADHLLAVVLAREDGQGGLDDAAAEAQHEVQRGLLLDVVVAQGAAVLELLAREDQTLLVRGDALLVLDLGLDVVDRVGRLDVQGDGLARQGLHLSMVVPSVSAVFRFGIALALLRFPLSVSPL